MNILETKGLYHDFSGLEVLFDVNLQVEEGERHAVIGPNGAGKTTLFNVITGTYQPSRGQVFFKGKEITGTRPHKLMRLGVGRSFQITSTFNRLTTFQNIRLAILSKKGIRFHLFRKVDKMQDITKETDEVLRRINLDQERDVPAGMLSYGKHRSLEISLALATDPDLIMLDEPTAGMSRDETHYAVELIRRLTEGKTASRYSIMGRFWRRDLRLRSGRIRRLRMPTWEKRKLNSYRAWRRTHSKNSRSAKGIEHSVKNLKLEKKN
jgi:branched-chain amino acid transport system ATP-binding protein